MITPEYVQTLALYNKWQNHSLYGAADTLCSDERLLDRGAFFKSIQATLTHILWGDTLWLSIFDGGEKPDPEVALAGEYPSDWDTLKIDRLATDNRFIDWGTRITQADLEGDFTWYSRAVEREITKPKTVCVAHIFNHQTHHRGQVHAMLTAAGTKPDDTDLPFIPDEYQA